MTPFSAALDTAAGVLRVVFLIAAAVTVCVCLMDWAVRTRRISPFSRVARLFRARIDPLLAPIERRIVRSGGIPSNAPWWALGVVVLSGILIIVAFDVFRAQAVGLAAASTQGGGAVVRVLVSWAFGLLQIALLVVVVASWVRMLPSSPWVRWAFVLTDPILRPLRRVIPPMGMIDLTPVVAYFLLWLLAGLVLRG